MAEETHVAVSHEAEPAAEAVETTAAAVATAGAAVALAQETAAHAELQAAEEVAEIQDEAEIWRAQTSEAVSSLSANLATMNEKLTWLSSLEAERHSRDELLNERLSVIEAHPSLKSIPPESEATEIVETNPASEDSLVGAEATANLGPAEVGGGASLQNPLPEAETSPSPAVRKRRWI